MRSSGARRGHLSASRSQLIALLVAVPFSLAFTGANYAQDHAPGAPLAASAAITGDHPLEAANYAAGPEIAASTPLAMQVVFALRNSSALDRLLAEQQDPSSPEYHHWLKPGEFVARFGPSDTDVAAVRSWLAGQGFTVEALSADKRVLGFSGAATQAEAAFAVKIHTDATGTKFANLSDPVVPKSLAPIIASLRGLSNLTHAQPNVALSSGFATTPAVKIGKLQRFGPNDIYTFYDQTPPSSSSNNGSGADCIAVIEVSDFDDASVNAFDQEFGVAPINLVRVLADGSDPGQIGTSYVEALLDVEYAHAAAPGVPIYAYIGDDATTNDAGLLDAAARAITDDTCGAISLSFSVCGAAPSFFTETIDPLAKQAASQGQAVFVSSGDDGAAGLVLNKQGTGCVAGRTKNVNEISADPNVTSVGGTQFKPRFRSGNDVGNVTESVWHNARGASGGGESAIFAKPSYQTGIISTDPNRDVPDVSFAASPITPGFFLGFEGQIACCVGGTSLGAPYWAGIAQLAAQRDGKRVGPLNPALYSHSSNLRDVTKGNNGFHGVKGFKATVGYDRATGLGTPDIENLLNALAGP